MSCYKAQLELFQDDPRRPYPYSPIMIADYGAQQVFGSDYGNVRKVFSAGPIRQYFLTLLMTPSRCWERAWVREIFNHDGPGIWDVKWYFLVLLLHDLLHRPCAEELLYARPAVCVCSGTYNTHNPRIELQLKFHVELLNYILCNS